MLAVFDVKLAFTQSEMEEELYVEQPTGFEVPGKVCKLNMALEGTKQAANLWQRTLNKFMTDCVERLSPTRACIGWREGESVVICAVHVDACSPLQ